MENRTGSVLIYEGEERDRRVLGELDVYHQSGVVSELNEIRISHTKSLVHSDRCPPLAVLLTIAGTCFIKLESTVKNLPQDSPLSVLHATCIRDNTAIVAFTGKHEIVLIPMRSNGQRQRSQSSPCFWGFNVSSNVYENCLSMLNRRCLGIVFDLDETLVVANTLRSFRDKIEGMVRMISLELDEGLISGMQAELRRYQEDNRILQRYAESDEVVVENGKVVVKAQSEVVVENEKVVRPVIRLVEKNVILTRINPQIRDTSVLVRLRPGWEDFRGYLSVEHRKRFEVFVCTMAEREYALEMWRLLDPESELINSMDLSNRVVSVKSGNRKSLFNVFRHGDCHPEMAFVIDDRVDVWDEKDQARVHVVPAFAPYHAPQAEPNNASMHVLHVARNVACYVRSRFFKEFDERLLKQISRVAYEDDIRNMPSPPHVINYLIPDNDPSVETPPATNVEPPSSFPSQQLDEVTSSEPSSKPESAHPGKVEIIILDSSSSDTEEGEVPESELHPSTRRRLLISQHGSTSESPDHANSSFNVAFRTPNQFSAILGQNNEVRMSQCSYCRMYGHFKRKCPKLLKKKVVLKRKATSYTSPPNLLKKNDKKKIKIDA